MSEINELVEEDLEEQYEEAILKEFTAIVDNYKKLHGFDNDSMKRILKDIIKNLR